MFPRMKTKQLMFYQDMLLLCLNLSVVFRLSLESLLNIATLYKQPYLTLTGFIMLENCSKKVEVVSVQTLSSPTLEMSNQLYGD
jgi:hypothetical protein